MCGKNGDRISKHNFVRDVFLRYCRLAGFSTSLSEALIIPDRNLRPGDVVVRNWAHGRDMAFDIVITSPLQAAFMQFSASADVVVRNKVFASAEQRKDQKSLDICQKQGFDFTPLAFDTFGGFSEITSEVMARIVAEVEHRSGLPRSDVLGEFRQRISLGIQRFNANMLLARLL